MQTTIPTQRKLQVRHWPLVIGVFLSLVTARVLFDDVWHGAEITTSHILSLAAIVVALTAGHYAIPQLKARALVSGLMLGLLFSAATAYVVISSGARNAEQSANKTAHAAETNDRRAHEQEKLAEAETMLAKAQADLARECRTGRGSRCRGVEATVSVYEAAVRGHKATLEDIGPEQKTNAGYAHAARVLAALPYVSAQAGDIEESLTLLLPFIVVLLTELGTITFLHMALSHRDAPASTGIDRDLTGQSDFSLVGDIDPRWFQPDPTPPRGPRKSPPKLPDNVVALTARHPVIKALERNGGAVSSNLELAHLMGVSPAEACKSWQEVSSLVETWREGKRLCIALKSKRAAVA